MKTAFKEWAVVCRALSQGTQIVILRKGGIVERGGEFQPDHPTFLLFPTYLHQSPSHVVSRAQPWLSNLEAERPKEGTVQISHYASVVDALRVDSLTAIERLRGQHIWSDEIIAERFHRWRDSIYALIVRVYTLPTPVMTEMLPEYGGCTSWVELAEDVSLAGGLPVLDDATFNQRVISIRAAMHVI